MHLTAALWIGLGVVVVLAIVGVLLLHRRSPVDLGTVSDQWVGQHRATPPDDVSR